MKIFYLLIILSVLNSTFQAQWIQKGADIDGEAVGDGSGRSVSMSSDGNTIAIGAKENDGNGNYSGHVRIYEYLGEGILENDFGEELSIYPNPTAGDFTIELGDNYEVTTVTLMEISGKIIRSSEYNRCELLNLRLEESAGVYLLKIEWGYKKAILRLVKN